MASKHKQKQKDRPAMIHCEYCGEDYASTYKHCPFCDEVKLEDHGPDEEETEHTPKAGKRLITNTRGGGYGRSPSPLRIAGMLVSLGIIAAAVIIVVSVVMPLVSKGSVDTPPALESVSPSTPVTSGSPAPTETIPADQTATGFTLSQTEFSMSDRYPDPITIKVTFIPEGSTGTITWTSSNPDAVTVDETGKVSHGTTTGSATITATMPGGVTQTCLVHNAVTSSSAASPSQSPSGSSSTLSLNRTDFTLNSAFPTFQMKVSGTSSTPVWSIANPAVATVASDGTVTYVSKGQTTLTCSVDGQTLTCMVRCS